MKDLFNMVNINTSKANIDGTKKNWGNLQIF